MKLARALQLIAMMHNGGATYESLIEFLHGDKPPPDHNFLTRVDLSIIREEIKSAAYDDTICLEENPNSKATVGFLVEYPFHYYIYKNIYRHLPESEFILDAVWIKRNVRNWDTLLKDFIKFLKRRGVEFRVFSDEPNAEKFFKKYKALISNAHKPALNLPCNETKKKIRVMYGHAKDLWNFGPWSRHFDLALVYGPYSHKAVSHYTQSAITGNARFDHWFRKDDGKDDAASLNFKKDLDANKKTILYLPTHGNLSSLESVALMIPKLLEDYNLIIKPHALTLYTEPDRLDRLRASTASRPGHKNIIWVDDFTDNVALLGASDAVISDNSGAIFDAVLTDKPLITLDTLSDRFFEKEMWNIRRRSQDAWNVPLTYDGSIEQRIKRDKEMRIGESVRDAGELPDAIIRALTSAKKEKKRRDHIKKMIFSYRDGAAGKRAAEKIAEFLTAPPQKKTFFALQTDMEVARTTMYLRDEIGSLQNAIESHISLRPFYEENGGLNTVEFSVVVPTYNSCKSVSETMYSLTAQKGIDASSFEIIVVDDGSSDDTKSVVQEFIRSHPRHKILYLRYETNKGAGFARNVGILHAEGDFVAFTDDDCVVPPDWITSFKTDFKANPEVAGVGGRHFWRPGVNSPKLTAVGRYLYWRDMPWAGMPNKSSGHRKNLCGCTANVCYRKSVLKKVGGFNHYYPAATEEDTELAIRICKAKFSLLYMPRSVLHKKKYAFGGFIRNNLLRGLARYITIQIHPSYHYVTRGGFFSACRSLLNIWDPPYGAPELSLADKMRFSCIVLVMNACLALGKYYTALNIIARQDRIR